MHTEYAIMALPGQRPQDQRMRDRRCAGTTSDAWQPLDDPDEDLAAYVHVLVVITQLAARFGHNRADGAGGMWAEIAWEMADTPHLP
jgi:hypothetical protein